MTKKHFEAMAAYVRAMLKDEVILIGDEQPHALVVAIAFADIASEFNPRFNRERFMVACGLSDGISSDSRARCQLFESSKSVDTEHS